MGQVVAVHFSGQQTESSAWWALEKPWRLIDTVGSGVYLQKQEPPTEVEGSRDRDT